jgi:hypothetical protein
VSYKYSFEGGRHVVLAYPSKGEMYGGEKDGKEVYAGFELSVHPLMTLFNRVSEMYWYAPVVDPVVKGEEGKQLIIIGSILNTHLCLRVLAMPPEAAPVNMQVDHATGGSWPKAG